MNRRSFLQLSIAAAVAGSLPAVAAEPLTPRLKTVLEGRLLKVRVALENRGSTPVDVLFIERSGIGVQISGRFNDSDRVVRLSPQFDKHELMTRAGPRRVWRPVPANGQLDAGEFHMELPPGIGSGQATFIVEYDTHGGAHSVEVKDVAF